MPRTILAILLVMLLLLAACQQEQPPAPTLDTSLATPAAANAAPTNPPQQPRELVTGQPQMIPGTVSAPATEDPMAGTPFERILFTRSGGVVGQTLTVEILGDGTVTRNGETSQISPEQVQQITDVLDQLDFFGLQGVFTAPGTGADIYQYSITVDRADGSSRTIKAQDGLTPQQMMALFTVLAEIGVTR